MGRLIELAAWILIESAKVGSVRAATVRITGAMLCLGFAVVLMLAAIGCAVVSGWIFALPAFGPAGAPLVVSAGLSIVTLILMAVAWLIVRRRRTSATSALASQFLLSEASRIFSEHKGAVLLAALLAGMAAASGSRKS